MRGNGFHTAQDVEVKLKHASYLIKPGMTRTGADELLSVFNESKTMSDAPNVVGSYIAITFFGSGWKKTS